MARSDSAWEDDSVCRTGYRRRKQEKMRVFNQPLVHRELYKLGACNWRNVNIAFLFDISSIQ